MCAIDYDELRNKLSILTPKQKKKAVRELQSIVDEAIVNAQIPDEKQIRCPHCESESIVKNGHNDCGHQRYKCKDCGRTFVNWNGGNLFPRTKLTKKQWMDFCNCFVESKSVRATAVECDVSVNTSLFMRRRVQEIVSKCIPSFEVKAECNIELDEMYLPESFKGNHRKSAFKMPRKSHKNGNGVKKKGLSNDQIAVMTGTTDNGDFFYEVACRGNISGDVAERVIRKSIPTGAIVSTDKNCAYGKAFEKIIAIGHKTFDAKSHKGLGHVNALHGKINKFLSKFNGVSTKWLSLYLAWFKWLESFAGTHAETVYKVLGHIIRGNYEHVRRELRLVKTPFYDSAGRPVKC